MRRRGRAAPASLPEHHLELFLVRGASHGRRIRRIRRNIEMLSRHEARTDLGPIEGARDLVCQEGRSIGLDPPARSVGLHEATLPGRNDVSLSLFGNGEAHAVARVAARERVAAHENVRAAVHHADLPDRGDSPFDLRTGGH